MTKTNCFRVHIPVALAVAAVSCVAAGASWVGYVRQSPPRRQMIETKLGEVVPGKVAEGRVLIPNPTRSPLTLKRITKDCGCVSVNVSRDRVNPGEETELSFRYNTPTRLGPLAHTLEMTYQELPFRTIVHITGTVVTWVKVDRDVVDFGEVRLGGKASQVVRFQTADHWVDDLRDVEFALEGAAVARIDDIPRATGSMFDVHLVFAPTFQQTAGDARGELALKWKGMPERVVRVPCVATVVPRCVVQPSTAFFGVVETGDEKRMDIQVQSRLGDDDVDLRTCSIEYDLPPAFSIQSSKVEPCSIVVSARLRKDNLAVSGLQRGEVRVVGPHGELYANIPIWAMFKQ